MADVQRIARDIFKQPSDLFVAIGVIVFVMMVVIPLPSFVLDAFMALNLVLSLLVILMVLYTRHALQFSVFPTLLLILTVFGLGINISSTRLILVKGSNFDGRIVKAFGTFVVGTSETEGFVIGLIIFVIIIIVQFLVITKGSTRVAEVAARFTLDALPGKQMAIEAEYSSGLITEEEATRKKNDLQREVDFYGAMDGASKFVSGNVKVGIIITLVNIIGGMIVGTVLHAESMDLAVNTYIPLAIGDGLVTQLPALLISTSTGIIVTRSVSEASFGKDITTQFGRQSRPYWIAAAILVILGILPGFPWYVLFPFAGLMVFLAITLFRKKFTEEEKEKMEKYKEKEREVPKEMSPVVPLDPLSLEIGYGLIPLVDKDQGAELLNRITRIRRESAFELGIVVPRIRIIDNMRLEPPEYTFKINGVEVGKGKIRMGHYLAINPGGIKETIPGEKTKDPAFGLPAIWITEESREKAEQLGYTVVDPPSIIATHFTEIIKKYASEILGRQGVKTILDTLKNDYPAVIEEVNKMFSVGEIHKVLQGLLKEQVSIRNIIQILETLADYGDVTKNVGFLIEKARQALKRQICAHYADQNRIIRVLTLSPGLEQTIIDAKMETTTGLIAALEPGLQRRWVSALVNAVKTVQDKGINPVILCSEAARPLVKSSSAREVPHLVVLSVLEIVPDITIESLGEIALAVKE
ncbi:MAG: flagellar biosynthesis protein FlhA [Spirochaetales bacterium]|nr:flagellar biosynthesis protein FlhA [Spirochaetales bacterium]